MAGALATGSGGDAGAVRLLGGEVEGVLLDGDTGEVCQPYYVFHGRTPDAQPDHAQGLRRLISFLEPVRKEVHNAYLAVCKGKRDESRCSYSNLNLFWDVMLGMLLRLPSFNQMDALRNVRPVSEYVMRLAGQPHDPDDVRLHTACSQTCKNFLKSVDTAGLELTRIALVKHFLRIGLFADGRLRGCIVIAFDATLRDHDRDSTRTKERKRRYVLEAKIITPWGWSIAVASEPVDPYDGEKEKQDCESAAFARLAPRIKKHFPRLGICIVGDALYANKTVMDLCGAYKWEFVITNKQGVAPARYRALHAALGRSQANVNRTHVEDGGAKVVELRTVRWVDGRESEYDDGEVRDYRLVTCEQTVPVSEAYKGEFITSFQVSKASAAEEIVRWGRRRWNIENSFKVQKHDGYGLGHAFCKDVNCAKNVHELMQIAHILWQVFYRGELMRLSLGCRKMTQVTWADALKMAARTIRFLDLFPGGAVPKTRMSHVHMRDCG